MSRLLVAIATFIACLLTFSSANAQSHEVSCPGKNRALVLSGGGIRGAYQVGSLWYLVHVLKCDFAHFVGTSTGALTAAVLAQATDRQELQTRVNLLVQQYASLRTQEQLVESRTFGKLRLFLPRWLGGIDGLYSLAPLEKRLLEQVDVSKFKTDNLTVTAISLQSGSLDYFRPVSPTDYVLGSASMPLAMEPRRTRLWIRGVALSVNDGTVVLSTPFPPGLADRRCQIQLTETVVARCEHVATKLASSTQVLQTGNEYQSWHTTLRVLAEDAQQWEAFAERVRLHKNSFDSRLMGLLGRGSYRSPDDFHAAWPSGLLVEFTTEHQLVDGAVTENLPVLRAAKLAPRIDTLIVLAAGETLLSDKVNDEISGGAQVAARAFEVLWDRYQLSTVDYISLLWSDFSYLGSEKLRNPLLPSVVLLEPWRRYFRETLEVRPDAIRKAMLHGCELASVLGSPKLERGRALIRARLHFNDHDAKACDGLQQEIDRAS